MAKLIAALILVLVLAVGGPADAKRKGDQERARSAVEAGELVPLKKILRGLGRGYQGRLLDADLEEVGNGRWLYRLKVLTPEGNVLRLIVDGASGELLDVRGGGN